MTLATAARTLSDNYLGAQYSSPEEKQQNQARALELDVIAMRLDIQDGYDGPFPPR